MANQNKNQDRFHFLDFAKYSSELNTNITTEIVFGILNQSIFS